MYMMSKKSEREIRTLLDTFVGRVDEMRLVNGLRCREIAERAEWKTKAKDTRNAYHTWWPNLRFQILRKRRVPNFRTVARIAAALEVSVAELFSGYAD